MMELIADSFDIRCCECGEQITIFKDDLDTDVSFYDQVNRQGKCNRTNGTVAFTLA